MERVDVISVPFYKFTAEKSLVDSVYKNVVRLDYVPEPEPNNGLVFDDYYNEDLFIWFNDCVSQVSKKYYSDSLSFPIVDCWVNKYKTLHRLKKHRHSNSVICGLYYVTDHNSGSTIFEHINPWTYSSEGPLFNLSIDKNNYPLEGSIVPKAGTLILFPGNLYHYMKTYKDTENDKYTIAFNTFPSGQISSKKRMQLEVKTLSVQEYHKRAK